MSDFSFLEEDTTEALLRLQQNHEHISDDYAVIPKNTLRSLVEKVLELEEIKELFEECNVTFTSKTHLTDDKAQKIIRLMGILNGRIYDSECGEDA